MCLRVSPNGSHICEAIIPLNIVNISYNCAKFEIRNSWNKLMDTNHVHQGFRLHFTSSSLLFSLQETYEAKRIEFLSELQRKEEEMRQMFVNKVKETEAELKEREKEVKTN